MIQCLEVNVKNEKVRIDSWEHKLVTIDKYSNDMDFMVGPVPGQYSAPPRRNGFFKRDGMSPEGGQT